MLLLEVKAIYPLSMSRHPMVAGRPTETHDYITGSALRGAVATEYLKGNSPDSSEFERLFLSDKVKWGNLYPSNKETNVPGLPLPATALSCKRYQGFTRDEKDYLGEQPHGIRDCLIEHITKTGYSYEKCFQSLSNGKTCDLSTDGYRGFYQVNGGTKKTVRATKRLDTHTAIDPDTQAAKFEALFTMEVIEEGQEFIGFVDTDGCDLEERIRELLPPRRRISVGNDRSRGLGLIEITDIRSESLDISLGLSGLEDRIKSFQQFVSDAPGLDNTGLFTIFLCSDAIIRDSYLRHQTYIDTEALNDSLRDLKVELPQSVELHRAYASSYIVHGWNMVGKLPKHVNLAIQKGSVFVFKYHISVENQVIDCLKHIEKHGTGERRSEGFGKVMICNPFHQEVSQNGRQ